MTNNVHYFGNANNAPDFPLLDATRNMGNAEFNRVIMDVFGYVEPFIEEADGWVSMPLRLVHNQAAGWVVEVGPYDVDHAGIERLREAIAAYDKAVGR